MIAEAIGITYDGLKARLKEHGYTIPSEPAGGARWHDIPCPICEATKLLGTSLRIQSRQGNAELGCRNGCGQLDILRSLGYSPQQVDAPATREGNEKHSGQLRMAYRLAESHRNRLIFVPSIGWHYWDWKRWVRDEGDVKAKQAVLRVLRKALVESASLAGANEALRKDVVKCETANGADGVLRLAAAMPELVTAVAELDADPYLLNVANGTLDLQTMELRPHDPADRITKVTLGAYDAAASAPEWAKFIGKVLPDREVRMYLQRVAGMSLQGKVVEHILPILTGTGANGKGSWYTAMLKVLGDYASTGEPDLFMARDGAHPTGQADLLGKRLIVVSESDEGRKLDEAKMKRLTGGDVVKARFMRRDFFEFEPSHIAYLVTNYLPKVSGDDPAVWRRLRVIPFNVTIPPEERDGHLGERLLLEADGILTWIVNGWKAHRRKGLSEPAGVLQATAGYQRDSDAIARFIEDECTTSSDTQKVTTQELFQAWERWRAADGAELMSEKRFGQALDKKGHPTAKGTGGKRYRVGIRLATKLT